ncbi:cytochrome P450 [Choiromyces venosus 120613-1]|uniref:Cytochrome P450 n=1 Tax=Choiromyces venosus 120613-1 TaxID=1336337 RepID=A0A3N4IZP5_9PEZI|nr:cytochrome P450 [Choiromyces venosus 120613-1]
MTDSKYFPNGIANKEYLTAAICAFATLVVWKVISGIFFSPLSHIPGPPVTAITPHYINFLSALNRRTVGTYALHKRYGPIVRISPTEVSVLSPQAIKEVYSSPHYTKYTPLYSIFTHFGAQNAFTSCTREEHGWRRKAVSETYSLSFVLRDEAATGKVLKVVKDYLSFVESDRRVDIYNANTFYATDVVTGKIFGLEASMKTLAGNEAHREIVLGHYSRTRRTQVWMYIEFPLIMNVFEWFAFYTGRMWSWACGEEIEDWEMVSQIQKWGWDAYMDAKSNSRDGTVAGRLARLVQEGSNTEGVWNDRGAVSEVMDQMLAGMDTTGDTLSFLMYQLSLPESRNVQKRLHSELLDAFPKSAEASSYGWPHTMDIPTLPHETILKVLNLPYLDAVLKETLRLYTAIPITLPRVVPPSTTTDKISGHRNGRIVEGHFIPAGTTVGTLAYGIHRDEVFSLEPEQKGSPGGVDSFLPERWLINGGVEGELTPDELAQEKQRIRTMEARLWAFGSGGRNCVGRHLSILEMKLLLVTIYSRYQTQVTPNSGVKITHNRWNERRTFRDVLPFRGVDGIVTFTPYEN